MQLRIPTRTYIVASWQVRADRLLSGLRAICRETYLFHLCVKSKENTRVHLNNFYDHLKVAVPNDSSAALIRRRVFASGKYLKVRQSWDIALVRTATEQRINARWQLQAFRETLTDKIVTERRSAGVGRRCAGYRHLAVGGELPAHQPWRSTMVILWVEKKNGECSGREFFCRVLCGFQLCAVPWAKFSFWIQKKTRNATRLETLQINLLQASSLIRLMLGDSSFLFYIYFMNNYACFHIPELNRRWFVEGIRFCPCCVSMQTISFTCTPGRLLTVSVTQQLTYATWMREKGGIFPPDKESKHRVYSGVWPSVSTSSTGDLRILLHGQTRTHSHSPGRNFLGKATAECCVC